MKIVFRRKRLLFTQYQLTVLGLVFLGAANFANRYYYWTFFSFLLLLILKKTIFRIDLSFVMLMILGMSIVIFDNNSWNHVTDLIKPFSYVISYVIGYNMLISYADREFAIIEEQWRKFVLILVAGNLFHLVLNWSINIGITERNTIDYWKKDILSATGQMAIACLIIGCACAYLFMENKKLYKILAIIALIAILSYNLILAGRTVIVLIFIMLLVAYCYYMICSSNLKYKIYISIGICIILLLIIVSYRLNVFDIKTIVEKSNLYLRFFGEFGQKIGMDKRFDYKKEYMSLLVKYPFGGNNILTKVGKYAHDLYLDAYDEAGIFAFGSLVIYVVMTVKNLIEVLRCRTMSFETRQLMLCTYAVLYIEFMIEPILIGEPWLFATFCLINGATVKLLKDRGKKCV